MNDSPKNKIKQRIWEYTSTSHTWLHVWKLLLHLTCSRIYAADISAQTKNKSSNRNGFLTHHHSPPPLLAPLPVMPAALCMESSPARGKTNPQSVTIISAPESVSRELAATITCDINGTDWAVRASQRNQLLNYSDRLWLKKKHSYRKLINNYRPVLKNKNKTNEYMLRWLTFKTEKMPFLFMMHRCVKFDYNMFSNSDMWNTQTPCDWLVSVWQKLRPCN